MPKVATDAAGAAQIRLHHRHQQRDRGAPREIRTGRGADWKAPRRLKVQLAAGPLLRNKTVIALARQLAMDLGRWRTGRATMEELGRIAV